MSNEFLCFLDKDDLQVNEGAAVALHNGVAERVIFYLMLSDDESRATLQNPDRLTGQQAMEILREHGESRLAGTTYLMVILPCGEAADSFIDCRSVRGIHFEADGWTPSEWTDLGTGDYAVLLTNPEVRVDVGYADSFRFCMDNIVSQAPPGITNFSVKLLNTGEGEDLIRTFELSKRPAALAIADFSPDRHGVAQSERVTFTWKAAAHREGIISPGAFRVGQGAAAFEHAVERSTEYRLQVQNAAASLSRRAPVYLVPLAVSRFEYDPQGELVRWCCRCARTVAYNGAETEARGEAALEPGQQQVKLLCRGHLLDIEETLYLPADYRKDGYLRKTVLQFPYYAVLRLRWRLAEGVSVRLSMGLLGDLISERQEGEFEYAAAKMPQLTAELQGPGQKAWRTILQKEGVLHL
ncbi:hypothetical protein Sgly_1356 [Syntrophobotulus glycolicus DSM 8271]|uniref:Uncharacterized protein n=1 Tax=Syntrophobotulus glycolicus (strain DSM 8271 / FlGlyR) TaxID=645991 RepID=F0SVV5_SYNGF|nr:hypothetical protein [Syntrophobotulus glycolicus]ADY55661.1 hypothetical protein Sgly_1356 [Syntrophobotulus glycolicus DSM 8271]